MYYLQSRYYDPEIGRFLNADALVATGYGVIGYNMFTYCGNNPVICSDSTGYRLLYTPCDVTGLSPFDDSDNVAEPTLEGTISFGAIASFCLTGWAYFAQISLVTDFDGDAELQLTLGATLTTGELGGSLMTNVTYTNAPNVEDLHGMGYQIGGTAGAVAVDGVIIPYGNDGKAYGGVSVSTGIATPDAHVAMGFTFPLVVFDCDMLKFFDELYKAYWGIY